jgi:SET domain-containing protein
MWNVDFDFWVLLTGERKCGTNSFGLDSRDDKSNKDHFSVISRLTSFFQNSCECNANWGEKDTADTMVVTASRTILKGEEIFVSYGVENRTGLEERRAYMRKWIGANCECTRCVREARSIAEAA